jgi:hypothetical protein
VAGGLLGQLQGNRAGLEWNPGSVATAAQGECVRCVTGSVTVERMAAYIDRLVPKLREQAIKGPGL